MLQQLWDIAETLGAASAPTYTWRRLLGDDFEAARKHLRLLDQENDEFPCPSPGGTGCPRIVVKTAAGLFATCGNQPRLCDSIRLDHPDDPLRLELRLSDVAEHLANALVGRGNVVAHALDGVFRVVTPMAGQRVFLDLAFGWRLDLPALANRLVAEAGEPILLVTRERLLADGPSVALAERAGARLQSVEAALRDPGQPSSGAAPSAGSRRFENETGFDLTRSGATYRARFAGKEANIPASRGLAYLVVLVNQPARSLRASELFEGITGERLALGSAGDVVDSVALVALQRRARTLAAEIDDAREMGARERAANLQEELEAIADQVASARGLGGRRRRMSDDANRVRDAVAQAIRRAISQIGKELPAAGAHLKRSLRLGNEVRYEPVEP